MRCGSGKTAVTFSQLLRHNFASSWDVLDRFEIFDGFCHWFDEVGGRLVNHCFRLCWLGCIEKGVWLDWGDCMRILSDKRLMVRTVGRANSSTRMIL